MSPVVMALSIIWMKQWGLWRSRIDLLSQVKNFQVSYYFCVGNIAFISIYLVSVRIKANFKCFLMINDFINF